MSKFKSKRFHLIIDAFDCEIKLLSDVVFLTSLIKKIAKLIRMKIIKGPIAVKGVPVNPGLTVFAIVDFSHISIHTFTKDNQFCLDIFSCKPFDYKKLNNFIKQTFHLKQGQIYSSLIFKKGGDQVVSGQSTKRQTWEAAQIRPDS